MEFIWCALIILLLEICVTVHTIHCPYTRHGMPLDVEDLVGSWVTVYTQPNKISCFTMHIRAITDLEKEQCATKYGDLGGKVKWDSCFLELISPEGKHYLQGYGNDSGILENIIIEQDDDGKYVLLDESADQWIVFGRRGNEMVVMRDCLGETAAVFSRAPYWPTVSELYSVLHRSGITPLTLGRILCEPFDIFKRLSTRSPILK